MRAKCKGSNSLRILLLIYISTLYSIKLLKDKIDRIKQLKDELERIRVETPNIWKRFFEWYHKQTLGIEAILLSLF